MTSWRLSRRTLLATSSGAGAMTLLLPGKAPAQGGAKPFAGTTINVACWSATYPKLIADYLPEFEAATGIRVNYDTPAFPIFNQRADLELSTKGSAYDVLNLTFIYVARWIGAGWFTPLDEFLGDEAQTPATFEIDDFLAGARAAMSGFDGKLYAVPWTADCQIMASARFDQVEARGQHMPATLDELGQVLQAISDEKGVSPFATENIYHWTWLPFLQGFGGRVFRNPPDDLMPALDSPEAIASAEAFTDILKRFGPNGVISYSFDQTVAAMKQGRVNFTILNHAYLVQLGNAAQSKVAKTVRFGPVPRGPAGAFPQVAVHGWGIPIGSKNKGAGWEFIKWSMSKDLLKRMLDEKGYAGLTRASTLQSPAFKAAMTVNGQDLGQLYLDTVDTTRDGHMAYRTVHVFPQAGQQINHAIEAIASGQQSAKDALTQAQTSLIADLKRAGVQL
jgi:multiple sugar transport system substrate-binding protein